MQISNTRDKIIQNLKDCDCDEAIIEYFMEKFDAGQKKEALAISKGTAKACWICSTGATVVFAVWII